MEKPIAPPRRKTMRGNVILRYSPSTLFLLLSAALLGNAFAQQAAPQTSTSTVTASSAVPTTTPTTTPTVTRMPRMRATRDIPFVTGIQIADGRYEPAKSTLAGKTGGRITDSAASGITLQQQGDSLNPLYIHGSNSNFTLSNSKITLTGNGEDDFVGIAAGTLVSQGAQLTLRKVNITTNGTVSSALTVTEGGVLKVYDSTLRANGGLLPSGFRPMSGPGMMVPPTPLAISGTARTTLTMDHSKSYFYNSKIIAEGWGALSTDNANGEVYVEANNCDIDVLKSGYGTYSDNGATVVINNSRMHTATYAGIIAGQASIALNNDQVVSGDNVVMIHSVRGTPAEIAKLSLKGGDYRSGNAALYIKSANADISLDGVKMAAKNGDLILSVVNENPIATKVNGQKVFGIQASISNSKLRGNILHLDTEREMKIRFDHATLQGVIKNAKLAFDRNSRWTATGNSSVTLLGPVDISQLDAPRGVSIQAVAAEGNSLNGSYTLASGGTLMVQPMVAK